MARRKKVAEPLPTIWRVDDRLWWEMERVLEEHDPPARFGPERINQPKALDGVFYGMRSGVQWNQLPKEFGDDSSVHRTFQRWGQTRRDRPLAIVVKGAFTMLLQDALEAVIVTCPRFLYRLLRE